MRINRGFTFIEVTIVVAILSILIVPFLTIVVCHIQEFHSLATLSDLRSEADSAAYKIFRLAADSPEYTIHPDNRGITFPNGSTVRLDHERLTLKKGNERRSLTQNAVTEFNLVKRETILCLNLTIASEAHVRGPVNQYRFIYDYPRMGVFK